MRFLVLLLLACGAASPCGGEFPNEAPGLCCDVMWHCCVRIIDGGAQLDGGMEIGAP